jgi:hypothetical protein
MATCAAEADAKNTSDTDPEMDKMFICRMKRQIRNFILILSAEPTMLNAEPRLNLSTGLYIQILFKII